jgi:hypothetical protein
MVTRSGTNRFSGSGYWFLRRTATSTNEFFLQLTQQEAGNPEEVPKLDKDIGGFAIGGPIARDKFFFFGNYESLKEQSDSVAVRGVPSDSFRDGILQYQCATASLCPATTVQGFSGSHAIPAGWYGATPAEVASLDPLGIGSNLAAAQYFQQFPSPNEPGLDGHNIMDYRFAGPIENDFKTFIGRADFKPSGNQSFFFRYNVQDDVINNLPTYPGEPPATQTVFQNEGLAFGWDRVFGSNLMNSFRYGWTQIDTGTIGTLDSNYVDFRFISDINSYSSTNTRRTPSHNIVNDFSWLKGEHAVKVGMNLRFISIPRTNNDSSYLSVSINPSWVNGVLLGIAPRRVNLRVGLCGRVAEPAGRAVAVEPQRELQSRWQRHTGWPADRPRVQVGGLRVLRAGHVAGRAELHADVRRALRGVVAAVRGERPAGSPEPQHGRLVRRAASECPERHPVEREPARHLRPRRSEEQR